MKLTIEKIADLEYNELASLLTIETDEILVSILEEEVKVPISMLKTLSANNKISKDSSDYIKEIFEKIILTKQDLVDTYNTIYKVSDIKEDNPIVEEVVEETIEEVVEETPVTKNNKQPKWYGKKQIEADIKNNGGKANNAQLTALAINELKNLYSNLNKRIINEMIGNEPVLTDEDYREIRATITLMKNKLKPIIKKSK